MSPLTRWTGPESPLRARMSVGSPPAEPAPAPAPDEVPPPPAGAVLVDERPVDETAELPTGEPVVPVEAAQAPAATPAPPAPGSRMARKALRAQAAAERRRNVFSHSARIAVPVVAVLALIVGLVAVIGSRGSGGAGDGTGARTQQTMLLQVTGAGSTATASVLLARSTTGTAASGVLIPGDLVTNAPSVGAIPFGQTARVADPTTAANAIADQLNVMVDGAWRLDANGLAALVDGVGGVTVDVASDVTDAQGNVVVSAGPGQLLDGRSAAAYAGFRGPRDEEQTRAARFSDVFTALLKALPTDQAQLEALVAKPGADATSTWNATQVASFLAGTAASARSEDLILTNLPVTVIDTGDATPSYRLDQEASAALVDRAFADSRPQTRPGGDVRVLVQNGVGTPGLGGTARAKLVKGGFIFVNGGNAAKFGRATSAIVVPDDTTASMARGAEVARTLGLPESAVQVSGLGQSVADLIVILGKDYVA